MLRVLETKSHLAMEFQAIQVNAYLFSTDYVNVLPQIVDFPIQGTANYSGQSGYAATLSWEVPVKVTENCTPSIIRVRQRENDSLASIGIGVPASVAINSPLAERTKTIARMDLDNDWDRKYCLELFD